MVIIATACKINIVEEEKTALLPATSIPGTGLHMQ
jgi:hypothetical protein